jgi:hypothetical protein
VKVNVWQIVVDHLGTLRNSVSKKLSLIDIAIFFGIPLLGASFGYLEGIKTSKDFYNVSITFFGVFVALLLNFQVAAFGIYNRRWSLSEDEKLSHNQTEELEIRRQILKEINVNISYLIVVSIFSILFFLLLYAVEKTGRVVASISWAIYIHFVLTLLMVVKRSHVLFRKEYDEN